MFQESMIESTGALRSESRWPAMVSFATQAAVVGVLLLIPLLRPQVMLPRMVAMNLAPPVMPHAPVTPPPVERMHVAPTVSNTISVPTPMATAGPRTPPIPNDAGGGPPAAGNFNLSGGSDAVSRLPISLGPPSGPRVSMGTGGGGGGAGARNARVAISGGVSAGLLLDAIRPAYPAIAKAAGVGGTVTVTAVITKAGRVQDVHAVSGPPLLRGAAEAAVRDARYRPFLLSGQPTEVSASFAINFVLHE